MISSIVVGLDYTDEFNGGFCPTGDLLYVITYLFHCLFACVHYNFFNNFWHSCYNNIEHKDKGCDTDSKYLTCPDLLMNYSTYELILRGI